MQNQAATRPVGQDEPAKQDAPLDLERADGEVVNPAAGLYGGYGGLREPDSASGAEPPAIDHEHGGFDREYLAWRDEQLRSLDADYRRWRDEGHSSFTEDFDSWRKSRDRGAASSENASGSQARPNQPSTAGDSSASTG